METLYSFFKDLPSNWLKYIFLGTNKKKNWTMEAKEDSTIIINKYRHQILRQIEFIIRALVFGVLLYFLNDIYLKNTLDKVFGILLKTSVTLTNQEILGIGAVIILIQCVITSSFYVCNFKNGLIGMDMSPSKKKKLTYPIVIINVIIFLFIYIRFINIGTIIIFLGYLAIAFIYCYVKSKSMKKHEIYRFFSGSRYNSTDNPLLHKDIYINLRIGKDRHKKLNLLENNLYICDNDDILIVSKSGKKDLIKKETIDNIQIKNDKITYQNNEWKKQ